MGRSNPRNRLEGRADRPASSRVPDMRRIVPGLTGSVKHCRSTARATEMTAPVTVGPGVQNESTPNCQRDDPRTADGHRAALQGRGYRYATMRWSVVRCSMIQRRWLVVEPQHLVARRSVSGLDSSRSHAPWRQPSAAAASRPTPNQVTQSVRSGGTETRRDGRCPPPKCPEGSSRDQESAACTCNECSASTPAYHGSTQAGQGSDRDVVATPARRGSDGDATAMQRACHVHCEPLQHNARQSRCSSESGSGAARVDGRSPACRKSKISAARHSVQTTDGSQLGLGQKTSKSAGFDPPEKVDPRRAVVGRRDPGVAVWGRSRW